MNDDITVLLEKELLQASNRDEEFNGARVLRRIGNGKDQQGLFTGFDDNGGYIVVNVIDLTGPSYLADAGIIRPTVDDRIFFYTTTFDSSPDFMNAIEILETWPLYKKHPELQLPMVEFLKTSYTPEYIFHLKKTDSLDALFIPMQQKLNFGRYKATVNPELLRKEKFKEQLACLKPGEHMTYVAMIPQTSTYAPKFYSIGTKPHEETHLCLRSECFNFKPTHGGHIKAEQKGDDVIYYVDAGSQYLGKGTKTKLKTAESVAQALRKEHSELRFIPLDGRGAFGTEQSY